MLFPKVDGFVDQSPKTKSTHF